MIFKHKRTGGLYRFIGESFSVERQAPSVIYMSLPDGQCFDRDRDAFAQNFEMHSDPQGAIVPKPRADLPPTT